MAHGRRRKAASGETNGIGAFLSGRAEGGGGRPPDTDTNGVSFLDCHTFVSMARLSGVVPTLGIVSGRC